MNKTSSQIMGRNFRATVPFRRVKLTMLENVTFSTYYSPLPERPRLSLRTINLIQSGILVRKCISGEKSYIVLSNYGGRQIKAKWSNEEFGYFNTITKIANAILCSLFMFGL